MKLDSLDALYKHSLADLLNAETQLIEALPKMAKAAKGKELKAAIEEHLKVTKTQKQRLQKIIKELDGMEEVECKAMKGLIAEADELLKEDIEPAVLDAALIGAAQKVEHYEIASYGTARTFARLLGLSAHEEVLDEILDEEAEADERLTEIAETGTNEEALSA